MSCSLCSHSEGLPSPLTSELNNPPGKTTHFNFPHRRNLWSSVVPHHGRHFASSWYSALREVCEQFGRWGHDYLDGSTWFWILHHHLNEHNDYWKLPQIPIPYTFLHHLHHDQSLPTMTTGPSKSPVVFFSLAPHTREISRRATSPSKVNIWPCPLRIPDAALVHISCQGPGASIPGEKLKKSKDCPWGGCSFHIINAKNLYIINAYQCQESEPNNAQWNVIPKQPQDRPPSRVPNLKHW